jgi:C2H2-type zinc finger
MNEPTSEQNKSRSILPQAPPLHEEPIKGIESGNEVCKICGKTFKTHTQLDRHMEQMHGHPEKTHTSPHKT